MFEQTPVTHRRRWSQASVPTYAQCGPPSSSAEGWRRFLSKAPIRSKKAAADGAELAYQLRKRLIITRPTKSRRHRLPLFPGRVLMLSLGRYSTSIRGHPYVSQFCLAALNDSDEQCLHQLRTIFVHLEIRPNLVLGAAKSLPR